MVLPQLDGIIRGELISRGVDNERIKLVPNAIGSRTFQATT